MRTVAQSGGLISVILLGVACSGSTSDGPGDAGNSGGSSAATGSGGAVGSGNAGRGGAGTGGSGNAGTGGGGAGGSGNAGTGGAGTDSAAGSSSGGTTSDAGPGCRVPDPSGCVKTGCPDGLQCDRTQGCQSSSCFCDQNTGQWGCTADCGGGTCVAPECVGCPLEMPERDSSCAGYPEGKLCSYAQQTSRCELFTGGTSSGRNALRCRSGDGALLWTWGY